MGAAFGIKFGETGLESTTMSNVKNNDRSGHGEESDRAKCKADGNRCNGGRPKHMDG
jgi:hypothetical protein